MSEHQNIRETRWNRIYYIDSGHNNYIQSKFLTNEAKITFKEIAKEWPAWNSDERNDFILGYIAKAQLNEEDFKILELLMEQAEPYEIGMLPLMITELPDKKVALEFLSKQILETKPEKINVTNAFLTNFYQAIGILGNPEAIPLLKNKISEMLECPALYEVHDYFDDIARVCIVALVALWKLDPKDDYIKLLEGFKSHPSKDIAQWAANNLEEILPKSNEK